MSQVNGTSSAGGAASTGKTAGGDLRDVDMDQFLKLLIAELQNQDPLNPMDNAAMLEQIGQIREIGATNKLTDTLDSVLLGQNLTTASSLIGRQVKALTDDAKDITGKVDRVSVETSGKDNETRTLKLHVGEHVVALKNIREIVPAT